MKPKIIPIIYPPKTPDGKFNGKDRFTVYSPEGIAPCMHTCGGGNLEPKILLDMDQRFNYKRVQQMIDDGKIDGDRLQYVDAYNQSVNEDVTATITARVDDSNRLVSEAAKELKHIAQNGRSCDVGVTINNDGSLRPYNASTRAKDGISEFVTQHEENSANTVTTSHGGNVYGNKTRYRIRKLTERECFRLMDLDDSEIDRIQSVGISKTAQYKLAGNSIVVSCLYHIFRKMFIEPQCEEQQLSLF